MDYLTEEELFELQHQDELDALGEMDCSDAQTDIFNLICNSKDSPSVALTEKKSLIDESCFNIQRTVQDIIPETDVHKNPEHHDELNIIRHEYGKIKAPKSAKEKENTPNGLNIISHESDKIKTPKKAEEKENTPISLSTKRKLSFSDDFSETNSRVIYESQDYDSEENSESLVQERSKRMLHISDNLDTGSTFHSAKKQCTLSKDTLEMFLRKSIGSQARSSFFKEVHAFSKDQVTLTCSDGRRKYFILNEEDNPKNLIPSFSQRTSSLLSIPIDVLKAQYFIMEEESELRHQNEITAHVLPETSADTTEEKDVESFLWVEKYRPVSYMHLLSEEGINRTLLQWLKMWDKVVFGKEKKIKKKKNIIEPKKNFQNSKFQKLGELIEEQDEHGRPHHKVAFLCGPPGLGKTTLAIIIARHAGYNVVELNASDDRNPEVFRTNIEAATQMKAVLHEDHRPNCLILDEIDGAPAPSINVLLSFIKSTGFVKGKRKKGDIPLLMRPIICICNDQYSPALKPLRQLSLVLNFPPTTTSRLANRLNEIAIKEGLIANMAALTLLCEKSSNDIRSCLSTLQFIHRMKKDLKVSDLEGLTIGQKDMQKSLFAVWQDVFYYTENPSFDGIFNTIQSFGDYDKVYVGIFENYVNIKFKHRNANHVWSGAEWLCFGDIIQQQIAHSQLYFLMPYLTYPPVAFYILFASNTYPHISYPAAFYEYKARTSQLSNTLTSMIKDMVSTLKAFLNFSILLLDVFPFLLEIIKPTLRPVNTQLYSEREKSELHRVIELMLAFNLNYRQERQQDGTYTYVLDPNIEELTKFTGVKSNKALTYSAKQMIAREVDMEQMRKGDAAEEIIVSQREKKTVVTVKNDPVKKNSVIEKPMLDFFGRKITESAKQKKKAKGDPRDEDIWFHFKEGYSNAVRRTVYIKDLL